MIFVLVVAAVLAALTWMIGWWGVLLGALIVGWVHRHHGGGGWRLALAGATAWGGLMLANAAAGPLDRVVSTLGAVLRVPGVVVVLLTLAFPALLAWSAATLLAGLTHRSATPDQGASP